MFVRRSGRHPVPAPAMDELRQLYARIERAARGGVQADRRRAG